MISDLINLLFPDACLVCSSSLLKGETHICVSCGDDMPVNPTFFDASNYTTHALYGRVKLANATSLLLFEKRGAAQLILHQLKYKGQENISSYLGKWAASMLLKTNWYKDITMVIPVPIHPKRLHKRGYNQVEGFGKVIADSLQVDYRDDILIKPKATTSQVFKKRWSRFGQLDNALSLRHKADVKDEHILIVDDIITTGATIESCGTLLRTADIKAISVLSMAITI